jgi:hypothetical protein
MDEERAMALVLRKNQAHSSPSARKEIRIPCLRKLVIGLRPFGHLAAALSVSRSEEFDDSSVLCSWLFFMFSYLSLPPLAWLRWSKCIFSFNMCRICLCWIQHCQNPFFVMDRH